LTRKLIALNVALAAVLALLIAQVRREWLSADSHQRAFLGKPVKPSAAPPLVPYVKPAPLMASNYASVAQMNLFTQDRNSNVILDPPAPAPVKPVPAFPVARGVMLWEGVPPTVVLSDRAGGAQKGYHPGDMIGEWKVVSIDNQFVVFEWDGKQFQKRLDELLDKTTLTSEGPAPAAAASAAVTNLTPSAPTVQTLSSGRAEGPGVDLGGNVKGCVAGDTSPAGTISGGMRKVVTSTPFGSSCHWESAH
jgi:hypothetical protein